MNSQDIRQKFVAFFEERDHVPRPSSSLIPNDPTLLLTNAGMVQFKSYFLGEEPAPWPRAVTVQKSFRTVDIDIVGTTARHFTFFEMLGNFSFGDYFKEKAIPWAFEFVTDELNLDPDLLWFTVHETDDEAEEIWISTVGIAAERVQRRGKDNYWQMGVPGPCGPSSEIFVDRGPKYGPEGGPLVDEERYTEIWNLVFMQNIQDEPYHVIGDLPAKNIDTGSGLERVAMILQEEGSVFDVDVVRPVRQAGEKFSGIAYGDDPMADVSLRILADHGRAIAFLIGDGVMPSNEGRGHVLRRMLRRTVRHAWQLGGEGLVTPQLVDATAEAMGDAYPELAKRQDFIKEVVSREETRFRRTLVSGHQLLDDQLSDLPAGENLAGSVAFKLHDTYGFPIELTSEIAAERGVEVDLEGFDSHMEQQRTRARAAWRGGDETATFDAYRALLDDIGPTDFLGYEHLTARGRILAIHREGEFVERAEREQDVEVFLDRTPFYAEAGGQVGDIGLVETSTGRLRVSDTQSAVAELHGHRGTVERGYLQVGQTAEASIDAPRREGIAKSHTGTHILHSSLREVVGDHVHQAGSLVDAGRLRFDFSHYAGLSEDELTDVERLANTRVIGNSEVTDFRTSKDEATELGALAFFGDKYGDQVRVVQIGHFSLEFCGGTHTPRAGQVGPVVVTSESSIGANVRRVEALVGETAYEYLTRLRKSLTDASRLLSVPPDEVPARTAALLERAKDIADQLESQAERVRNEVAGELAFKADSVGEGKFVVSSQEHAGPEQLRKLAVQVRGRLGSGVVVLGSDHNGKGALVGTVTADLVERGVSAGELIAAAARELGGGGSRDPDLAQAGGPRGDRVDQALSVAREAVTRALEEL